MSSNFIYLPALSVGAWIHSVLKNDDIKFFNKELTKYFHYPHVLSSAGHLYKKYPNYAERIKFNLKGGGLHMGDSGGYQIATKQLEYSDQLREDIFHWLENNTNLAVNLDIPPFVSNISTPSESFFQDALDISYKNFKYFNEKQTGKTRFLTVMQGRCVDHWDRWYGKVKDFDFGGWCIGSVAYNNSLTLQALFYMLMHGEFDKKKNQFFHILGTSKPEAFIYLIYFAHLLKKNTGCKSFITSDSSSPNKNAAFGGYYLTHDFLSFKFVNMTNRYKLEEGKPNLVNPEGKLPCNCKVCKALTLKDIFIWNSMSYTYLTLHNTLIFLEYINLIKRIMECDNTEMIESYFPAKIANNLKLIKQAFETKNPVEFMRVNGTTFDDNTKVVDINGEFF
jgi:hypothetical protein